MSIIVGLDPGTGKSSPTAIGCIDSITSEIYFCQDIINKKNPNKIPLHHTIVDIGNQLGTFMATLAKKYGHREINVYLENFVMRGKGGQTLAWLVGALIANIPIEFTVRFVQNTTVKAVVGGDGRADKYLVGLGVIAYFKERGNKESAATAQELLDLGYFDRLDALAIGIAGEARKI